MNLRYILSENADPEERLEDAAMWKAMRDVFGKAITQSPEPPKDGEMWFGRGKRDWHATRSPIIDHNPYWNDSAFLKYCGRAFEVCNFEDAKQVFQKIQRDHGKVFIKSTRPKHCIIKSINEESFEDVFNDWAYSFMDGGPKLMIQQLIDMEYERRVLIIDRKIVTHSPVAWHLTPLDTSKRNQSFKTPQSVYGENSHSILSSQLQLAENIASEMELKSACVDIAMSNGKPVCIEYNSMIVGQIGLYACDPHAIANSIKNLISAS